VVGVGDRPGVGGDHTCPKELTFGGKKGRGGSENETSQETPQTGGGLDHPRRNQRGGVSQEQGTIAGGANLLPAGSAERGGGGQTKAPH